MILAWSYIGAVLIAICIILWFALACRVPTCDENEIEIRDHHDKPKSVSGHPLRSRGVQ